MSLSIHRQLIRGIKGLNPTQVVELQAFLSRVTDAQTDERSADDDDEIDADGFAGSDDGGGDAIEFDLPQPVCAQEEPSMAPAYGWGPPPLVAVQFDVIGCLIREANEARNARRQRFGM